MSDATLENGLPIEAKTLPMTKNQKRAKHQAKLFGLDKGTQPAGVTPSTPSVTEPTISNPSEPMKATESTVVLLKPSQIIVNQDKRGRHFAPRKEDIARIGASMKEYGQLEPIGVRQAGDKYELIYGYTRHAAAIEYKIGTLKAEIIEADDDRALVLNITENASRNSTSVIDDAHNQQRLRDKGWSNVQIGQLYSKSSAWIGQVAKLLVLSAKCQKLVHDGKITAAAAIGIASSGDTPEGMEKWMLEEVKEGESAKTKAGKPAKLNKTKSSTKKIQAKAKAKKNGEKETVSPRSARELFDFFQSLTGPAENENFREFGKMVCKFIKNKISDKVFEKYLRSPEVWDAPVSEPTEATV